MIYLLLNIALNLNWLLQSPGGDPNKNLNYLFVAYVIVWVLIAGYLVSISRRQKRLDEEVEMLKQMRNEK